MRTELLKCFLWLAQGRVNSRNSCEAASGWEERLWAPADAGGAYRQHAPEAGVRSEEPGAASQPLLAMGRGGKPQKKWGSLLFFSSFLSSQACQTRRLAAGLLFIDDFCFGAS